jgi:hypothetical protein
MAVDPLTGGSGGPGPSTFVRYRKGQCGGMQNSLQAITEAHEGIEGAELFAAGAGVVIAIGLAYVIGRRSRKK